VAIARLIAPDAVSGAAPTSAPVHPDAPRDPETARAALQLVHSYLTEVPDDLASQVLDQPQMAGSYRSTLALAAKQLDIAERADPTAKLLIEDDGKPVSISQQRLRARMIALEALTWTVDKPRKEIRLLTQATQIDPSYAPAFHLLGTAHLMTRNRTQAIAALERACALDPGNIQMLKALDRARNMTDAEIATFRLSNAAAKTTAAGIKTWNILKLVWIFGLPLAIVLIVAQFTGSMLNAVGYIVGFYVVSAMFVGLRRLKDWFDDFHV
jgi:tetratricopeptide (TPR) repeat protein